MKKLLYLYGFIIAANVSGAGLPVIDLASIEQAILQLSVLSNQLAQTQQLLNRLGDPSLITDLVGAAETLSQLARPSTVSNAPPLTGAAGMTYDGQGLYHSVDPEIHLGKGDTVKRPQGDYKKFEAVHQSVGQFQKTTEESDARRDSLRKAVKDTTSQIQAATTDAEIQKLNGVLAAQNAELATVSAERAEAAVKVLVQHAANEEDRARQEQADLETRKASLQSGIKGALDFLKADSKPTMIPTPK